MVVPRTQDATLTTGIDKTVHTMESENGNADLKLLSPVAVTPRNRSPVTVQQWVDSLPVDGNERRDEEMPTENEANDAEVENLTLGAEAAALCRPCPSVQITSCAGVMGGGASDAGSHCSSMESLLEARKPDPEEILMELGFGGSQQPDNASRIPSRFLHPSQLKGVAIDDFLREQKEQVTRFESGFSGYRGLSGPSHTAPSSIVGKIMERLREAEVGRSGGSAGVSLTQPGGGAGVVLSSRTPTPRLANLAHNVLKLNKLNQLRCVRESVLSPDNRRWLESQGDKSPEPGTRRIIIGHKSFTFAKDGDLVEAPTLNNRSKANSPVPRSVSPQLKDVDDSSESEKEIIVPSLPKKKSLEKEQLELEYKSVVLLANQLTGCEQSLDIGTEEKFCNLSAEERRGLEVGLIEKALAAYQKRLEELHLRSHLRHLMTGHLNKVTDVLDNAKHPSLLTVVKQLTTLLRHQDSLREELRLNDSEADLDELVS